MTRWLAPFGTALKWRWGELNPRPLLGFWIFYGCSFNVVLLGPGTSLKRHNRRAQPELKSRVALRRNYSARFLNDVRTQNEITSGLTDFGASLCG